MAEQTNYTQQEPNEKVIKGSAKMEKPKLRKRVIDFLFSDKIDSINNYVMYSILGPGLRRLLYEMGNGMLSMILLGQNSNNVPPSWFSSNINGARREPTPYERMSQYNSGYGYAQPQPGIMPTRMSLNDISFDTKDDAWLVLDRMNREIGRYQKVRVADFYTYAGITGQESNWALQGNGWYDLSQAHPMQRTDGRWVIDFPPVQTLR